MSASPDFMTQLLQGSNGMNGSLYSPTMGLALGLLQAGGPSRMPVSLGQALGQGIGTAQQFQGQGLSNAMQQIQLKQALQGQQYFQGLLGGQPNSPQPDQFQASQAPTAMANAPNGTPQTPAPVQTAQPKLPALMDPEQDPKYQQLIQRANLAEYFKVGSGASSLADAKARQEYLSNQTVTLTPEQAKLLIPGGTVPGQSIQYHPYTGKWETGGTEAVKPSQQYDEYGNLISPLRDVRTGAYVGGTGGMQRKPGTPLPGPLESQAQGLADYTQDLEGISKRGMTGALLKQRAVELNPQWDETTYKAKQSLATDFAKGASGKALLAFNTATSHLDTMSQAAAALQNGDVQTANRVTNMFGIQLGKDPVTNFNTVKQLVAGEVAKAIAGGNVAEGDREKANAVLNAVNSPEQLQGAIAQIRNLMGGKLAALKTSYDSMGLPNFEKKLTPAALASMQNFESQNQAPANTLPQGWSVVQH